MNLKIINKIIIWYACATNNCHKSYTKAGYTYIFLQPKYSLSKLFKTRDSSINDEDRIRFISNDGDRRHHYLGFKNDTVYIVHQQSGYIVSKTNALHFFTKMKSYKKGLLKLAIDDYRALSGSCDMDWDPDLNDGKRRHYLYGV